MPEVRITVTQNVHYSREVELTDDQLKTLKGYAESSDSFDDPEDFWINPHRDAIDVDSFDAHDVSIYVKDGDKWVDAFAYKGATNAE